jgi:hypothetical protein
LDKRTDDLRQIVRYPPELFFESLREKQNFTVESGLISG